MIAPAVIVIIATLAAVTYIQRKLIMEILQLPVPYQNVVLVIALPRPHEAEYHIVIFINNCNIMGCGK